MHDKIYLFISECAKSKIGRFVFVAYLVYLVSMISHVYGHIPFSTYPYRFYGERELFQFLNWPQLELIRSSRLIYRWQASKLTDAFAAVYIAMPWWVYGYLFECVVKRIADTCPRELSEAEYAHAYDSREVHGSDPRLLSVASFLNRIRTSFSRKVLR